MLSPNDVDALGVEFYGEWVRTVRVSNGTGRLLFTYQAPADCLKYVRHEVLEHHGNETAFVVCNHVAMLMGRATDRFARAEVVLDGRTL